MAILSSSAALDFDGPDGAVPDSLNLALSCRIISEVCLFSSTIYIICFILFCLCETSTHSAGKIVIGHAMVLMIKLTFMGLCNLNGTVPQCHSKSQVGTNCQRQEKTMKVFLFIGYYGSALSCKLLRPWTVQPLHSCMSANHLELCRSYTFWNHRHVHINFHKFPIIQLSWKKTTIISWEFTCSPNASHQTHSIRMHQVSNVFRTLASSWLIRCQQRFTQPRCAGEGCADVDACHCNHFCNLLML